MKSCFLKFNIKKLPNIRQIYYSFPVRLLLLHWRNHLILILLWLFLALLMTGVLGHFFGMYYLLLTPEYRGEVGFASFFLEGAAFGTFFMIWNLTTYLLCASRFPFLATLEAPFTKFCLNNSLIPLGFFATWLAASIWFQWHDEYTHSAEIFWNIVGFLAGMAALIFLLSIYFYLTNHDIISLSKVGKLIPREGGKILAPGYRLPTVREIGSGLTMWRVDTYLNERLHPRPVRSVAHYHPSILQRVFRQNHFNAVIVMAGMLILLMILGIFMENEYCRIPTGATIFLLSSMVMSMFGATVFWFRNWGTLVFLGVLLVMNWASENGWFTFRNQAYGLDYQLDKRAEYSLPVLEKMASPENISDDKQATLKILNNWLAKNRNSKNLKPKIVFLSVSGGGFRSAYWTMQVLQQSDLATDGKLFKQTSLISGASGGMLGAGYFREIYLRNLQGENRNPHDPTAIQNLSRDLLNPVCFGIIANDLLVPLTTFKSGNFDFRKDRGYLFERQLNENCENLLGKKLADYRQPEAAGQIPMMFVTPYILNDARRMVISSQPVRYMMRPPGDLENSLGLEVDGVDFGQLFKKQDADSLAFTSALRMNCTYPYILPNAWLPARPMMEVLDAGFRDNYGLTTAVRFVHNFKKWISENTGGVVFVQIRCWEKYDGIDEADRKGFLGNLFAPATVMGNMTASQDFEQDESLSLLENALGEGNLEIVRFIYRPVKKSHEASMNLHLSKREKLDLGAAYFSVDNKKALEKLKEILK